jgi:CheY-like chemotaxis protein
LYLPQAYVAQVSGGKGELRPNTAGAEAARATASAAVEAAPAVTGEEAVDVILPPPSAAPTVVVHDIELDDDRNLIHPGDPVLLIIEDDVTFARILMDMAHDRGMRALVALRGATALTLAREFSPGVITLDINLPDMVGWTILDRLKHDTATRHIPVHVITGDENRRRGLALGAVSYLEKSIDRDNLNNAFDSIHQGLQRRTKKLLIVSPDEGHREAWKASLNGSDVEIMAVGSGGEALAIVKQQYLDGLALDLRMSDIPAVQLAEEIQAATDPQAPPMIFSGVHALTPELDLDLRRLARLSVIRFAESRERLLEEAVLLLHRADGDLSPDQRELLASVRRNDIALAGKKVLVVDDDVRNIFALTSVLEQHHLQVVHAENGRAGIETLLKTPDVDGVLMDIMMPEMDGYETTRAIRQIAKFRTLPIIAVTAKAMKGDRAKCIEAGASDYITKPVDLEQLFSVLRVWIIRNQESSQTALTAGK